MAPKKKNKKPIGNPARGFATTSVSSKAKVEAEAQETQEQPAQCEENLEQVHDHSKYLETPKVNVTEVPELTPEEYEAQLEESELQMLVEKYAAKLKKEVSKTVSRLLTERRLFRGQVELLPTSRWVSDETTQDLLLQVRTDLSNGKYSGDSIELLTSEILSIKLWALQLCLAGLGFEDDIIKDTLIYIIQRPALLEKAQLEETRENSWGLGIALEWLGISREEQDLPVFDASDRLKSGPLKKPTEVTGIQLSENVSTGSSMSGEMTPEISVSENSVKSQPLPFPSSDTTAQDSESHDSNDEDLNPREQLERFIELRTRLFRIRPDLLKDRGPSWKKSKTKQNATSNEHDVQTSKLLKRIKAIESDILFDKEGAQEIWVERKLAIIRNSLERTKLGLENKTDLSKRTTTKSSNQSIPTEPHDALDGITDFFATLPQDSTDEQGNSEITTSHNDMSITIRDFGKWTGLNPRRIFEDTCRSRDSGVRITYEISSQTSFSVRYSVRIQWARPRDIRLDTTVLPGIVFQDTEDTGLIRMETLSTPEKMQSEALVSVAALFHIFSASPKEEKSFMRLPNAWRNLWSEYSLLRNARLDSIDRAELKEICKIAEVNYKPVQRTEEKLKSSLNPMANEFAMKSISTRLSLQKLDPHSAAAIWNAKSSSLQYQTMLRFRQQLPIWNFKTQILEAIEQNQILIICGETGCGKSTQTPAYILEHELSEGRDCKIYCTEPRRISAISLARRVSEELGERKHDVGTNRSLVGYAIRLESQISSTTRLVYATTGIVMRMLENPEGLEDITHIVLDEVHERTIDSDFLLIVLRRLLINRPDLKIVLMSATVNAELFSQYLGGAPVLNVPGRTFPVEVKYLEDAVEAVGQITNLQTISMSPSDDYGIEDDDTEEPANPSSSIEAEYSSATRKFLSQFNEFRINFNLIVRLLEAVASQREYLPYSKAILVFLPGLAEIRKVNEILIGHHIFSRGWEIFPLHSTIATEAQEAAFDIPPPGIRKIVLATNIAETGITIPDITCVIDTGKHREMRFDERRQLSRLIECFISKANAKQRRGRAGRVQDGLCFHLFTKARHDNILADQQTPEMLRLSLQDLSLRVKICRLGGIEEVLMQALDAPSPKNIRRAVDSLIEVKALTIGEELTSLGRQLAKLPLDVYLGKLIIFSAIFLCLDAGLTIAAILTSKSPFSASFDSRNRADQARLSFRKGDSDLLTVYNAYCSWRKICKTNSQAEQQFCRKNFLVPQTLVNIEELKGQLAGILLEANFLKLEAGQALFSRSLGGPYPRKFVELPSSVNVNNSNELIVNAIVTWSFYPKLLSREGKGYKNIFNNQAVSLHPGSINKGNSDPPRYLSYYSIMQSSSKFYNALETSTAEDFAVALACGDAEFKIYSGIMTIDGNRIRFAMANWKVMMVIKGLRAGLKEIIAQNLRLPGRGMNQRQKLWFDAWNDIFTRQNELRKQIVR